MQTVALARNAMNTRFELVLHGDNAVALQAAGEAALAEIERIDHLLSLFRPGSEIARVNALAAFEAVRVSPEVFRLLERAKELSAETGGAFDISMAPLLRCWGLLGRSDGRMPSPEELAEARAFCGMPLVELDRAHFKVRFARKGVMLDLGAIGKGYGVEQAAEVLREAGMASALIHGGTSTIAGIGAPPDEKAWKISIHLPEALNAQKNTSGSAPETAIGHSGGLGSPPRWEVHLQDEALSVSAVAGKCFVAEGRVLGHIIDPRTGEPAKGAQLTAVVLPSATETDALSTALLVAGSAGYEAITTLRPEMRTLLVGGAGAGGLEIRARGIEPSTSDTVR